MRAAIISVFKYEGKTVIALWIRLGVLGLICGAILSAVASIAPQFSVAAPGVLGQVWKTIASFYWFRSISPASNPSVDRQALQQLDSKLSAENALLATIEERAGRVYGDLLSELKKQSLSFEHRIIEVSESFNVQLQRLEGANTRGFDANEKAVNEISSALLELEKDLASRLEDVKSALSDLETSQKKLNLPRAELLTGKRHESLKNIAVPLQFPKFDELISHSESAQTNFSYFDPWHTGAHDWPNALFESFVEVMFLDAQLRHSWPEKFAEPQQFRVIWDLLLMMLLKESDAERVESLIRALNEGRSER